MASYVVFKIIKAVEWISQGPALNPMEILGNYLKRTLDIWIKISNMSKKVCYVGRLLKQTKNKTKKINRITLWHCRGRNAMIMSPTCTNVLKCHQNHCNELSLLLLLHHFVMHRRPKAKHSEYVWARYIPSVEVWIFKDASRVTTSSSPSKSL